MCFANILETVYWSVSEDCQTSEVRDLYFMTILKLLYYDLSEYKLYLAVQSSFSIDLNMDIACPWAIL